MQGKRIAWSCSRRERRIPSDEFRRAAQIQPRRGQRRRVKRLANVAGGIRPWRMLVRQHRADGEVQQRGAS